MHGRTLLSCIFLLSLRSDVILERTKTFFSPRDPAATQEEGAKKTELSQERGGGVNGGRTEEIQDKF